MVGRGRFDIHVAEIDLSELAERRQIAAKVVGATTRYGGTES